MSSCACTRTRKLFSYPRVAGMLACSTRVQGDPSGRRMYLATPTRTRSNCYQVDRLSWQAARADSCTSSQQIHENRSCILYPAHMVCSTTTVDYGHWVPTV